MWRKRMLLDLVHGGQVRFAFTQNFTLGEYSMIDATALPAGLLAHLAQDQITLTPVFNAGFIRMGSQWFTGYEAREGSQVFRLAFFGDFARSKSAQWEDAPNLTPETRKKFDEFKQQAIETNQAARLAYWEQVQPTVEHEWENFSTMGESPYLTKKGLPGNLYGCRLDAHERGARTIVPARDADGKLWGYQIIFSEKLDIGDKLFRKGARKEGCFHVLGDLSDGKPLFVFEGIATAISGFLALDREHACVAVFDAGNLIHVARALRKKYPDSHITFAADHDQFPAKDGQIYHTGFRKAEAASKECGNAHVVLPVFKRSDLGSKPTDFNDAHVLYGLSAVKEMLLKPVQVQSDPNGPPTAMASGEDKPSPAISEARLVKSLLDEFHPNLIRQGRDFFLYRGSHWEHMEPLSAPDHFKRLIDRLAGGKLKFKDIQSAYNRFFIHVPMVPEGISLFAPNPLKQNFRNGTLELVPASTGSFTIGFHPHRREDYLVHCHDFDYRDDADLNPEFEAALDRIWAGDPDIEMKKQAYFEVLGACLVSAFRKLVLFVGKPKTGKSTLILFAVNMVHEKYRCSVDPTQFQGFNLESMAGKLLNYDTDINLVKPITDSVLKKVEDRTPMRIARKNITDIYAPIPGMQLFGANRMPVSQEAGQAYDRRMLVFRCEKFQPTGDSFTQDFAQHVWRMNPQGVLARAVEGLKRLCTNGGHFTVPESSKREVEEWQTRQGDMVQDFLADMDDGGLVDSNNHIIRRPDLKIQRKHLWEVFKVWVETSHPRHTPPGKIKFYGRVKDLAIEQKTIDGVRYFCGVGVEVAPGADI